MDVPCTVVTDFFLDRVLVSKTTSAFCFFLTLPPGSRFSISAPVLSFKDKSAIAPSVPASFAAFHLEPYATVHRVLRDRVMRAYTECRVTHLLYSSLSLGRNSLNSGGTPVMGSYSTFIGCRVTASAIMPQGTEQTALQRLKARRTLF